MSSATNPASAAATPEDFLRARLAPLAPQSIEIIDDSHRHAGHAGAREGRHYRLCIVAAAFAGKNTLERHRMVFDRLGKISEAGIHALAVQARAPGE